VDASEGFNRGFNDRKFFRLSICHMMKMHPVLSRNLFCFTLDGGSAYVLFDKSFPSLGQFVKKIIILKPNVDRTLTNVRWSRLKHLLEVHDSQRNAEKQNIRRVKITFTSFLIG
jgi:hypothetical protein